MLYYQKSNEVSLVPLKLNKKSNPFFSDYMNGPIDQPTDKQKATHHITYPITKDI